jgi:hypothetical protein
MVAGAVWKNERDDGTLLPARPRAQDAMPSQQDLQPND